VWGRSEYLACDSKTVVTESGFADFETFSLAYCELYLALSALTLRVFPRMRLFETTVEDVAYHHDAFVPAVKESSKGVRVTID
jgi:hypothetical protein